MPLSRPVWRVNCTNCMGATQNMNLKRHTPLLAVALSLCAAESARADTIQLTIPFTLPVGPSQQTVLVPQFDSAQGTLTDATITLSGNIQYVLDIFNTGPGSFSATVHDNLSFGGTPVMTGSTFSGTIPANQFVFTESPDALAFGPLTEMIGANPILIGSGTIPFDLSLPAVTVDQSSGATVLNVLAFSGASGNVTASYAFTPAIAAVPEPRSLATVAVALLFVFVRRRK